MDGPAQGADSVPRAGVALLLVVVAGLTLLGLYSRVEAGTHLEQPIAFSHALHAGEKQIPCQYCHAYARRAPVAGVPAVQTCMGCHALVAVRKPEIRKLTAYWQQQAPIPWVKIHNLPDFVYFSHKRHVLAGVPCQHCHGSVEKMTEVQQVAPLTMGWCVGCHMEVAQNHKVWDAEFAETVQPSIDCATCHK